MENKTNEFEGKEILKSDEAARLLGITIHGYKALPIKTL